MPGQPSREGPIAAGGAAVRAVAQRGTAAQVAEVERLLAALSRGPAAAERLAAQLVRLELGRWGPAPVASDAGGRRGRPRHGAGGAPRPLGPQEPLGWLLGRFPAPEATQREFPAAERAAVAAQVAALRARAPARAAPVEALLAALTGGPAGPRAARPAPAAPVVPGRPRGKPHSGRGGSASAALQAAARQTHPVAPTTAPPALPVARASDPGAAVPILLQPGRSIGSALPTRPSCGPSHSPGGALWA